MSDSWTELLLVSKLRAKLKKSYFVNFKREIFFLLIKIIIIIHTFLWCRLDRLMRKIYAICVKWTKFSEIKNRSLFIWLLYAVKTIKLRLCIKFVRDDCMLENECSCHFKLLQQLYFHHHSRCCFETLHDWNNNLIVHEVNIL